MNIPDTYTVDRAVDMIGFGWFQVKLSFFTGLVWVSLNLLFYYCISGHKASLRLINHSYLLISNLVWDCR